MPPDPSPDFPRGPRLKQAVAGFLSDMKQRLTQDQGGVPTFNDNFLLYLERELNKLDPSQPWEHGLRALPGQHGQWLQFQLLRLQCLLARRKAGRLQSYQQRQAFMQSQEAQAAHLPSNGSEIPNDQANMSQGAVECMSWRGMPLFKTVFDVSLYSMLLWELKPRSIIEIGSGTGASALWLADLLRGMELPCEIVSLDIKKPQLAAPGVTFIEGDCHAIETALPEDRLARLPHPWLAIEDAHENVVGVVRHLDRFLQPGDYLIIEDSEMKKTELAELFSDPSFAFRVDSRYTDFFGRNATCAPDSILKRVSIDGRGTEF